MQKQAGRLFVVCWIFRVLGIALILRGDFVVHTVLRADRWALLLFGRNTPGSAFLMAGAYLYCLPAGLLCLVAAHGLGRRTHWAGAVGIGAAIVLLFGFPWLTIAGGLAIWMLFDLSPSALAPAGPTTPTTDFWNSKRQSKAQPIALAILWIATFPLLGWFALYARRVGMPAWHSDIGFWLWYSVFLLANTALHESGHAIVAWAAGFKVRVVSIGPLTFFRDHSRFRCRFVLGRLFESGGYMGAVPVSDRHLRLYEIAVVAAGPLTNALTCLLCLAGFFSLQGTAWQNWWWVAALNAVFSGLFAVGNLIPLGYCDGTMLFHLIFWTPAGRLLIDSKLVALMDEEATACHGRANFDKEIELKEDMLQRSLEYGKANASRIVACRQALGSAYVLIDDWAAAEFQYRKCLEFEAELALNPMLAGNVWSGIHLTSIRRHQVAEAGPAYTAVVSILETRKAGRDLAAPAAAIAMLAQAHERAGSFESALQEIERGFRSLPRDSSRLSLCGHLLRTKAVCHLNLGDDEAGLAAARSAAEVFRSPENPPERRNLGWENICDLGCALWRAGQSALPIELLREGIARLDKGGASRVGMQYRIKLVAILRQLGRLDEAREELPAEGVFSPGLNRAFLAERAELHLVSASPDLAVADCRELLALWRDHPCTPDLEIASAEALLAKACLAAGDLREADGLALRAADVLGPWQHPDAASCLVTLALTRAQSTGERKASVIGEAFRLIDTAELLRPSEKARLKEAETTRIQQSSDGRPVFASRR